MSFYLCCETDLQVRQTTRGADVKEELTTVSIRQFTAMDPSALQQISVGVLPSLLGCLKVATEYNLYPENWRFILLQSYI